jgi:D-alanine-D-alanine ligase
MKVVLLMGGRSSEREISFRTGQGVARALRNLGHEVVALDAANGRTLAAGEESNAGALPESERGLPAVSIQAVSSAQAVEDADVVFIALHGGAGENGTVQALLELAGKPYTGSGVMASAVAMNKAMSKRVFEREGILTPRWQLVSASDVEPVIDADALGGYPLIVKPNEEGSTVGLTVVTAPGDLPDALQLAFDYGHEVLVEEYIPGRELTVAVIGDEPLPIVEIEPGSGHYDYEAKYTAGRSRYFCPADLPESQAAHIRELGARAARVLGCRGVSRTDFRLSPTGQPFCLEVNTIPGMTPTSLVPMAAKAQGMSYDQLTQKMIELALEDWRQRHGTHPHPARARA